MHTKMAQHCWTALHSHSHTKQWFSFLHPDWTTCLNITLRKTTFLEHTPGIEDDWEHLTRLALGDCFCCLIKAFCFFPQHFSGVVFMVWNVKKGSLEGTAQPTWVSCCCYRHPHEESIQVNRQTSHLTSVTVSLLDLRAKHMPRVLHVRTVWIKEDLTSHIWRNTTLCETYIFVEGYIYIRVWK